MALQDWLSNIQMLARWFHVLFGIVWIGHLYFFNFVNSQLQPTMDADTKKKVNPVLMPRALWWFRWGAMLTFILGLVLFALIYMYPNTNNYLDEEGLTDRGTWITLGGLLGTIMWFNVWFVIWPAQKKLIGALVAGQTPDAALAKRAGNFSKINTYLSGPMLFGMLAATHYAAINLLTVIIFFAIAVIIIWHLYKTAPKAGKWPT